MLQLLLLWKLYNLCWAGHVSWCMRLCILRCPIQLSSGQTGKVSLACKLAWLMNPNTHMHSQPNSAFICVCSIHTHSPTSTLTHYWMHSVSQTYIALRVMLCGAFFVSLYRETMSNLTWCLPMNTCWIPKISMYISSHFLSQPRLMKTKISKYAVWSWMPTVYGKIYIAKCICAAFAVSFS